MSRVAWRLTVADVRRFPGRTLAIAALLFAAALLPRVLDAPVLVGALVAVAVAFAAVVGAVASTERRSELLTDNGAPPRVHTAVTTLSMAVPGVVAFTAALAVSAAAGNGVHVVEAALVTVVLPLVTAPIANWAILRSQASSDAAGPVGPTGRRRTWLIVAAVVAGVIVLPLGLAVAGVYLASGAWSRDRVRRIAALVLSVLAVATAVVLVGASRTWLDLGLALTLVLPVLIIAVAVFAAQVHALVMSLAARLGPRFRLALAPLIQRGRVMTPLLVLLTLVLTVAVTEGVVGASFGEREAVDQRAHPPVIIRAGNAADQAIAAVPPVEAGALDDVISRTLAGTDATALVIEQVGTGDLMSPAAVANPAAWERFVGATALAAPMIATAVYLESPAMVGDHSAGVARGPAWLGIVDPGDLDRLGWGAASQPVAKGSVALLSGADPGMDGTVRVATGAGTVAHAAAPVDGGKTGMLLPGALVSRATAQELSPLTTTARVVVMAAPEAAQTPSSQELLTLGRRIQDRALQLPTIDPQGLTASELDSFDSYVDLTELTGLGPVRSGAERIKLPRRGGPLNAVPYFAETSHDAQRVAWTLVALPVLITLAVVFLALGTTRRDDAILEVQGAPRRLRSTIAAIQAGVMTVTASLVAVAFGIGLPAASFAVYNRGAELPDIPLVVPEFVWAMLIGVPIGTTVLAAALILLRGRRAGNAVMQTPEPAW